MKIHYRFIAAAIVSATLLTACNQPAETVKPAKTVATAKPAAALMSIPARPEALKFANFRVHIPDPAKYRHTLAGGNVAYIVEDHSLPLVQLDLYSRAGEYAISDKDYGVAYLLDSMLRQGGTTKLSPAAMDERLDFLATQIDFSISQISTDVSLDTLSSNLGESLDLMFDLIVRNRFDSARLAVEKKNALESIKRRNDDTRTIEPRVWDRLMRGSRFFDNREATAKQIKSVSVAQLREYAAKILASGELIIAVSGDVNTKALVADLNKRLTQLPKADPSLKLVDNEQPAAPGLYGVNKADVTQSRVSIGHPGVRRGNKDELAIRVMNNILGGGGFTSRITSRVRSDEGLAYSAGSYFSFPSKYDGVFRAYYQSKNPSVAYALKLTLEEINRIREKAVSAKELHVAQQSVISALGNIFHNAHSNVSRFAYDDISGIPASYWKTYEDKVDGMSSNDILRVAKEYLHPKKLRILVVGALKAVKKGDGKHGTLEENAGMKMKQLTLRDPLTLKPLPLN